MLFAQIPVEDPTGLLPTLIFILFLGLIWVVIRTMFKLATKVFMLGCVGILALGALVFALGQVAP